MAARRGLGQGGDDGWCAERLSLARHGLDWRGREFKQRRRRAGERGQRMLELAALAVQYIELHQRVVDQRFLLCDVESRGRAEVVARGDVGEGFFLQLYRAPQHVELNIDGT